MIAAISSYVLSSTASFSADGGFPSKGSAFFYGVCVWVQVPYIQLNFVNFILRDKRSQSHPVKAFIFVGHYMGNRSISEITVGWWFSRKGFMNLRSNDLCGVLFWRNFFGAHFMEAR